jgi:putative endonuclease
MAGPGWSACYCYILKCADGSYYAGWTSDPARRLKAHNAGKGGRYTRARRPVQMVFLEPQVDRSSAMKRERVIKTMTRVGKERLIRRSPKDVDNGSATGNRRIVKAGRR